MPPFSPGEVKTAIAPITVKPSGIDCEAELFLGPDDATKIVSSGRVPFVSTGATKNVSLPITMPSAEGTYHGYIDVFAGGLRFLAYKTISDITVKTLEPLMDIVSFHYTYKGLYTWGLGTMNHGEAITHIGFTFKNNEATSVSGVSVKMILEWDAYTCWLGQFYGRRNENHPAGRREYNWPLDQYNNSISQPFGVAPGQKKVWFSFTPLCDYYSGEIGDPTFYYGCPRYKATAEVRVNGELVASESLEFNVKYETYGLVPQMCS